MPMLYVGRLERPMTRIFHAVRTEDGQRRYAEVGGEAKLPRFFMEEPCEVCGELEAECHLCEGYATHFLEVERGTFYLCSAHSFLAHAWEAGGFGEYAMYAPTVDCRCDPWRHGSP